MASLWQGLHLAGNILEYNSSLNADSFRHQHAHLHLSLHLRVPIDHKLHAPTGIRFQGEGVALISNIRHFSADRFCRLLLSLLTWLAGLLTWLAGLARRCLGLLP